MGRAKRELSEEKEEEGGSPELSRCIVLREEGRPLSLPKDMVLPP